MEGPPSEPVGLEEQTSRHVVSMNTGCHYDLGHASTQRISVDGSQNDLKELVSQPSTTVTMPPCHRQGGNEVPDLPVPFLIEKPNSHCCQALVQVTAMENVCSVPPDPRQVSLVVEPLLHLLRPRFPSLGFRITTGKATKIRMVLHPSAPPSHGVKSGLFRRSSRHVNIPSHVGPPPKFLDFFITP